MSLIASLLWKPKPASQQVVNIARCFIGSLLDEVLEIVFDQLRTQDIGCKVGIVRVCRRWYIVATPFLYETVEPLSMRAMSQLSFAVQRRPSLATHIRTLKFPCLERHLGDALEFSNERRWSVRSWKEDRRSRSAVDWVRTNGPSHTTNDQPPVTRTPPAHCCRKVDMDCRSICLLLEWFTEVLVNCTQLHTLQLPTIDFRVSKTVYASFLTTVKHLFFIQLYVDKYGTLRDDVLLHANNVEILTISGGYSKCRPHSYLEALVDSSFFPKLHTLNLEQWCPSWIEADITDEIIKQHGPKLNQITLWPKRSTLSRLHVNCALGNGAYLTQVRRLTIVWDEWVVSHLQSLCDRFTSLTCMEIIVYTLKDLTSFLVELPRTVTLKELVITNFEWTAYDPNRRYYVARSLCTPAKISRLFPNLCSLSLFWRTSPHAALLWNDVLSDLKKAYLHVGIQLRMELIPGVPGDESLLVGSSRDRHRWTRL